MPGLPAQAEKVTRPRAADDFAAIRERLVEELRRERARVGADNATEVAEQHKYAAGHKLCPVDKSVLSPTIRRASVR